jgi:hypothetical protein
LIRRLSIDLTGLPPTIEQVDRFVADTSPDAYEQLVERLLESPAYGERWARVWLDLARYADSAGYAQDPPRTIWRYRDWVIDALNQNMPFDQFTVEQIAGDLLPDPTEDQLIATAFHRNTMTNSEGGTNDEEFRNAAVVDRVNTTMQVWMGLTMGCAQCHSHKYDPITHEDYFEVLAIFNNTADADRGNEAPVLTTFTSEQKQRQQTLETEIARLEQRIAADLANQEPAEKADLPQSGPLPVRYVRVELPGQGKFLHLAEVQAFSLDDPEQNVALAGKASQVSTDFGGPAKLAIDGNTNGDFNAAQSTSHTAQGNDPWWEVDLQKEHSLQRIVIHNRTDGGTESRLAGYRVVALNAKREPVYVTAPAELPRPMLSIALPVAQKLSEADRTAMANYQLAAAPGEHPLQAELARLQKELAGIRGVPTPIMTELTGKQRRTTKIQIRGNFQVLGDQVSPDVPDTFHDLPAGVEADRLSLARWLVDRDNPLTARVIVNRYWEQLFGIGLVETSEDFGMQGTMPSHPELLDWLAVEFMESGWDMKELVRTIVSSATYRQSSRVTDELRERDPDNRLLARGPRFRMSAEMIRDCALACGGLLSSKSHGPSVQPPRPNLGLKAAFGGSTDWTTSPGEDRYRRGLYTSWRRTTPYPSMATFDAPSREVCTIRRIPTNTPLQALVTLNDPVYVEAAQALARRMISEGGESVAERVYYGFRICLARPPTEVEQQRLVSLQEEVSAEYAKQPEQAKRFATDPLGPAPEGIDIAELAAWTLVGNVLLNLDEVVQKR